MYFINCFKVIRSVILVTKCLDILTLKALQKIVCGIVRGVEPRFPDANRGISVTLQMHSNPSWHVSPILFFNSIVMVRRGRSIAIKCLESEKKWIVGCNLAYFVPIWNILTLPVPDPGRREKINLNFYFYISLWCLQRFYQGLKGLHKTIWGTEKKCENKNLR